MSMTVRTAPSLLVTRRAGEGFIAASPRRGRRYSLDPDRCGGRMVSAGQVLICAIAAALYWTGLGWLIAGRIFPEAPLRLALAPALGWAAFSAAALPILLVIGFTDANLALIVDFAELEHGPPIGDPQCEIEILLDDQHGSSAPAALFLQRGRDAVHDGGLQPFRNLIDQQ